MSNDIKYIIKDNTPYMVLEFVETPLNVPNGEEPVQIGVQEAYKVYQRIDIDKIDFLLDNIKGQIETYATAKEKALKQLKETNFLSGSEMEKFFEGLLSKSKKYSKKQLGTVAIKLNQYELIKSLKQQIDFSSKQEQVFQNQYDFLVKYKNK